MGFNIGNSHIRPLVTHFMVWNDEMAQLANVAPYLYFFRLKG